MYVYRHTWGCTYVYIYTHQEPTSLIYGVTIVQEAAQVRVVLSIEVQRWPQLRVGLLRATNALYF